MMIKVGELEKLYCKVHNTDTTMRVFANGQELDKIREVDTENFLIRVYVSDKENNLLFDNDTAMFYQIKPMQAHGLFADGTEAFQWDNNAQQVPA